MSPLFISILPKPGHFGRRLVSVIAAALVAMWSIFAGIVYDDYRSSWSKAGLLGDDVATLVAQDVADVIEASGLALQAAVSGIDKGRMGGHQTNVPTNLDLGPLLVLDEHGHVVFSSRGLTAIGTDLSNSEAFRAQRGGRAIDQPYVDTWLQGRDGAAPRLAISCSLRDGKGHFDGVALGSIPLEAFRRGIAAIRLPRGSMIALTDRSATHRLAPEGAGAIASAPNAGALNATASIGHPDVDDVGQFSVSHRIPARALTLTLTIPGTQILRHWHSRTLMVGLGFLVVTVAICFLGFTAALELDRRGQAEQRLMELAATDGLTQLANRRRFDEVFDLEWRRAIREGTSISLVMVDGDFFKAFNDSYGHVQGDEALRRIAEALRLCASRPGDLVARVGGEEFVALLPSTDAVGAAAIAHAIRQSICALAIPHKGSRHGILTVSLGIASRRPSQDSHADLIGAADAALYLAKSRGRNCIVVEDPTEHGHAPRVA